MVEGARAATKLFRRKRSVESDAPSTTLRVVPLPRYRGGGRHSFPFSRCAFCLRPELCQRFHETGLPKREAERRKARTERPLRAIAALPLGGFVARAAFGGRARLPALYRGSRQRPLGLRLSPVPRFMAAPTDLLRPPPGQRAPRRPASGPAGRVSEPPANGVTNPIPGTAPARINRPSPVDVP